MTSGSNAERELFLTALNFYKSRCSAAQWEAAMSDFEAIAGDFESAGLEGVDSACAPVEAADFLLAALGPARCQEVYGVALAGAGPQGPAYPLARLSAIETRCVNLRPLAETELNDSALASIVLRQDPALPGFAFHRGAGFALIQLFR